MSELLASNPGLLQFLHRHVVPIHLTLKKGDQVSSGVITTFVMAVRNQWFLMTAGHVIEGLTESIAEGHEIQQAHLIDCFSTGATHRLPIPFDYLEASPSKLCYDPTYDYGVIFLRDHYRRLLEANGIQPFTEVAWERQPEQIDFYLLIGIPKETARISDGHISITPTMLKVAGLPERPANFKPTNAPTFWGQIAQLPPHLSDIDGMSGGPVLAVARRQDGTWKYWLHAAQSRWRRPERTIAACLMRPLGTFLAEFMEGKHRQLVDR